MYERWIPVRPLLHVALGVARDLRAEPARVVYELERPIESLVVAVEAHEAELLLWRERHQGSFGLFVVLAFVLTAPTRGC